MASLLVDTHSHLDLFEPSEVPAIIERARTAEVGRLISVAIGYESACRAIAYSGDYPEVFATVGVHPHEATAVDAGLIKQLKELTRRPKVVAVGETGLDYYRMRSPKAAQIEAFKRQIDLAAEVDLPLVIHCREAYDDLTAVLAETRPPRVVLHCYSGGLAEAVVLLGLNCYISFAGNVTFSNAMTLQEVAAQTPMERLLLETDAPYLAPQPHRGRQNEPSYIKLTAAKLAELKGVVVGEVVKETALNADKIFGLGLR